MSLKIGSSKESWGEVDRSWGGPTTGQQEAWISKPYAAEGWGIGDIYHNHIMAGQQRLRPARSLSVEQNSLVSIKQKFFRYLSCVLDS